jgi:hypothetical protein
MLNSLYARFGLTDLAYFSSESQQSDPFFLDLYSSLFNQCFLIETRIIYANLKCQTI